MTLGIFLLDAVKPWFLCASKAPAPIQLHVTLHTPPSTTGRFLKPHIMLPLESCGKRNAALGQCLVLNQKQQPPTSLCSIETGINTFLKMQRVHPKDAESML